MDPEGLRYTLMNTQKKKSDSLIKIQKISQNIIKFIPWSSQPQCVKSTLSLEAFFIWLYEVVNPIRYQDKSALDVTAIVREAKEQPHNF